MALLEKPDKLRKISPFQETLAREFERLDEWSAEGRRARILRQDDRESRVYSAGSYVSGTFVSSEESRVRGRTQLVQIFGKRVRRESPLEIQIAASKTLLDTPESFEEGEEIVPISLDTWERAVGYLRRLNVLCITQYGKVPEVPSILRGPNDGTIDLHWDRDEFELLINVKANPKARATFYGDDLDSLKIQGTLDVKVANGGLAQFLTQAGE